MDPPINKGRGVNKKAPGYSRRVWTNNEEWVLIGALKDLVNNGWKSDNGFRTGYLGKLLDAIKKVYPGTDLQVNPNIISKLTAWKKTYGSIVSAQRDTTGVGFNTTTNTLEVTDEQWEQVVEKDPSMKGMRTKEWYLFPHWVEIFGKDRATGEVAEDVTDAAATMRAKYNNATEGVNDNEWLQGNYVNLEDDNNPQSEQPINMDGTDNSSACAKETSKPSATSSRKRKNKADSSEPSMASVLNEYCHITGERLNTIASRMGYEKDLGQMRTKVFGLLSNVQALTMEDKLDVTELIGARNDRLEIFMGLDDGARALYAVRLLERERK